MLILERFRKTLVPITGTGYYANETTNLQTLSFKYAIWGGHELQKGLVGKIHIHCK